ncbi:hypothetical protein BDFB_015233, partial [Asbolus verrucosus]
MEQKLMAFGHIQCKIAWKSFETVSRCIKVFRETGSVTRKKGSGRPLKRTDETINAVEEIMENELRTSIRRLAQQMDLS